MTKIMAVDLDEIHTTTDYGEYVVLGEVDSIGHHRCVRVKFLQTGYEVDVRIEALKRTNIIDPFYPNVYGLGYLGVLNIERRQYKDYYSDWQKMLSKCYNPKNLDYDKYGAQGVRVCDRWLCFADYFEDVKGIVGHIHKKIHFNDYVLDEDYLQLNVPKSNRYFSKQTCIYVPKQVNNIIETCETEDNIIFYDRRSKTYHVLIYEESASVQLIDSFKDLVSAKKCYNDYVTRNMLTAYGLYEI